MKKNYCKAYGLAFAVLLSFSFGCQKSMNNSPASAQQNANKSSSPKDFKDFVQVNLTADNSLYGARTIDASLINGWGIDFPSSGNIRVVAEGSSMSNLYTFDGDIVPNAVSIPSAGKPATNPSHPTGNVCNQSADFKLPNGNPAQLILASSDGALTGWNSGTSAVTMVDKSPSASYFGIAMANDAGNNYLYLANFMQGKIDVYDKNWNAVNRSFTDPNMPVGYSPFNIQNIDGKLYVTYAKLVNGEEETGAGKGYINVFNANGVLEKRFASQGKLNAPWGIVKAPDLFWGSSNPLPNMILVANFGDGRITVFDENGNYMDQLHSHGRAIEIKGLWGIAFPPPPAFNNTYLYFAAGPNNEKDGLFGYIKNAFIN
jgi:uncharacterized protein (TIGR03118 family)